MAGMFYSLKEVAERIGKSEDEVRQLVKSGRLREFRDGPNLLFKVDEVKAMLADTGVEETPKAQEKPAAPQSKQEEEILLAPETPGKTSEEIELTDADTAIVEDGIKVLGDTDAALEAGGSDETFKGLDETPSPPTKEASLEEIEKDVSLDSFGSGSGLLDLSLQADDTSLGGILDEIYTPGGEGKAPAAAAAGAAAVEGSAMEVAAEAEHIATEQFPSTPSPAVLAAQMYAEPEPDAMSNAMGIMLFIPLLAILYTIVVAAAGSNVAPSAMSIVKSVKGLIWYIAGGMAAASILISVVGAMLGREKTPKAPKVKKEKPVKPKKEKKGKEAAPPKTEGKQ